MMHNTLNLKAFEVTHMKPEQVLTLIQSGESQSVEFKTATNAVPKSVFETVCAFSNRDGGNILLGVKDDGAIVGIERTCIGQMIKDFVTAINNENKMSPALYLIPEVIELDGRCLLHIYVPKHSQVCRCNGRIYDRNGDADIDITNNQQLVFKLYARKQNSYFVDRVFSVFKLSDLRADLIERARRMTRSRTQNHPWMSMTDEEMLRSAGLILKDPESEKEGITLAGILLFGADTTIMSVLSQHKTDAIYRVVNLDRYDDRDVICTNLLESYDRLMAFGQKHLNDLFVLDGIQSVSARDHILREIISNSLAHRDYSSGYVAKLVIERNCIYTENANLANGFGVLNPKTFTPMSKNPAITKVFREIGLADELGSGMRNSYKYSVLYSGQAPVFTEGDVFRITVPLPEAAATIYVGSIGSAFVEKTLETEEGGLRTEDGGPKTEVGGLKTEAGGLKTEAGGLKTVTSKTAVSIIKLMQINPNTTVSDIVNHLSIARSAVMKHIKRLKDQGLIERIGPDKGGYWKVLIDD